ncbi:Major facilitator superfamily domain general substrate transporter [Penicillium bovifimosum]|uniref:Major facilitator superfamily domain general substrate transporter n=1 Tax=Penicillium bovifimosum TaxID=126998 RepID=A0A9W9GUM3_9EURO|nr:Major facilitator superfamily domain general substrate transporter [Penicillium bovifimosum]KAJ5129549.1 Major facilitator superfamily domain general substrate transporter [Penicillium bovifimosum]
MIIAGVALVVIMVAQPSPVLLEWRAKHLRELTGDIRYRAAHVSTSANSLGPRLLTNVSQPFVMIWTEPIILIFSFYLVLLYFVLFTFLNGHPFIFANVYGISTSLTFVIFVAMIPGVIVALAMIAPLYSMTKKAATQAEAEGQALQPEVSLYWAMAGASIMMPVSLFWMAWTCYADYAASALRFMTFARYVVADALSPASVKMYENICPHWSVTIVAVLATLMASVPYALYKYGHNVRTMSKNAVNKASIPKFLFEPCIYLSGFALGWRQSHTHRELKT